MCPSDLLTRHLTAAARTATSPACPRSGRGRGVTILGASLLLLLAGAANPTRAASLSDFGYQSMKVEGELPIGQRALLLVLVETPEFSPFLALETKELEDLVFNLGRPTNVSGFFLENSNGRFTWKRALPKTVVGPIRLAANETWQAIHDQLKASGEDGSRTDGVYLDLLVRKLADDLHFPLLDYDLNADQALTGNELQIAFVDNNETGVLGATRSTHFNPGNRSAVPEVRMRVAVFSRGTKFSTICHELTHTLGALDLYGMWSQECLNSRLTLMSCDAGAMTFHLDPWHKMLLGWSEPRIRSLRAGGREDLPAPQRLRPDAPLLLYDPLLGLEEFFMAEYRSPLTSTGAGYDADVAGQGMVLWRVAQDPANHRPLLVPRQDQGTLPLEFGWRWCRRCQSMFHLPDPATPTGGTCPAGGPHDSTGSGGYGMLKGLAGSPGQTNWTMCRYCRGFHYFGNFTVDYCPANSEGHFWNGFVYTLEANDPMAPGQHGWRWCQKCQLLFYGPNTTKSVCPKDGANHDGGASANYSVRLEGSNEALWAEGPPGFDRGASTPWPGGTTLPYLRRLSGTPTPFRLVVHPLAFGQDSATLEWFNDGSESRLYVDFSFPAWWPGDGSSPNPFPTLPQAVEAAGYGSTIVLRGTSGPQPIQISKFVRLVTEAGPVTLGR